MITRTSLHGATSTPPTDNTVSAAPWQRLVADSITRLDELLDLLQLRAEDVGAEARAAADFPLRVPRAFVERMRVGDPHDPLLLQVLPQRAETRTVEGFGVDPLQEAAVSPAPGLLHKYRGRALLVVTGACAVHCRYCFRRHFPYGEHARDLGPALDYIAAEPSIREVLLSGGDPLSLSDAKLFRLLDRIEAIPHLERLRLHTRLPVVVPERVTAKLVERLRRGSLQTIVVTHINHSNEVDSKLAHALTELRRSQVTLLNQTVLLKGINDSADRLISLSETLFRHGVLPYYLHVLDRVDGAGHFEVSEGEARALARELLAALPGYLVPKLVREEPGAPSKTPVRLFES